MVCLEEVAQLLNAQFISPQHFKVKVSMLCILLCLRQVPQLCPLLEFIAWQSAHAPKST